MVVPHQDLSDDLQALPTASLLLFVRLRVAGLLRDAGSTVANAFLLPGRGLVRPEEAEHLVRAAPGATGACAEHEGAVHRTRLGSQGNCFSRRPPHSQDRPGTVPASDDRGRGAGGAGRVQRVQGAPLLGRSHGPSDSGQACERTDGQGHGARTARDPWRPHSRELHRVGARRACSGIRSCSGRGCRSRTRSGCRARPRRRVVLPSARGPVSRALRQGRASGTAARRRIALGRVQAEPGRPAERSPQHLRLRQRRTGHGQGRSHLRRNRRRRDLRRDAHRRRPAQDACADARRREHPAASGNASGRNDDRRLSRGRGSS